MRRSVHFFCGKAGAGKSTMATTLARELDAVLLTEDVWLSRLYGEQIRLFEDYIRFAQAHDRHVLHFLQTPDQICLERIGRRNLEMPEGASMLTESDYWHVTGYFELPEDSEGFHVQAYPP